MKNPKRFSPAVEEAWQKAIGLVNFTRGQKAQPGMIIDRPVYRGTKYTVAAFTPPQDKDTKVPDVRFNFRPTLAMPGDYVIFSSTDQLAEDLMDAVGKEASAPAKPHAGTHSLIEVSGPQLASILTANRDNLIRANMVDEGNTKKQAETEVDMLLNIIRHVAGVTLRVGSDGDRPKASLEVRLDLPVGKSGGK